MPIKTHSPFGNESITFGLKTLSAAVVSALMFLSAGADAAGLGKMTVLSSLGQPLRAEIELTSVTKEEAGSLTARVAPIESYRQANIDFNPALQSLQFAIEQRGAGQVIRVTSTQPINEPFVDMLLEVGSPTSRMLREYTFLLDPAETRVGQAAQLGVQPSVPARKAQDAAPVRTSPPVNAAPADATPVPRNQTAQSPAPSPAVNRGPKQDAAEYLVKKGDSLAEIASKVRPEGISLDQMLVALFRTNPDAFVAQNMNRLRSGQILSVPSAEVAGGTSRSEARTMIVAQAADFNEYRKKLAGQVAAAAPARTSQTGQSSAGKVTSRVTESSSNADDIKDRLQLSKADALKGPNASAVSPADAEDRLAQSKALEEANERVRQLEKNVNDLQSLLAFKNKELAERQQSIDASGAPAVAAAAVAAEKAIDPAATKAAPDVGTADREAAVGKTTAADVPAASAGAAATLPATGSGESANDSKTPKAPKTPAAPPVAAAEPAFLDDPLGHPLLAPFAGLLAIALGGAGIYTSIRRRKKQRFQDSLLSDSSLKANSLFGSTGGQSVDTNNSVFNSSFTPSASQLDTNEVDPVAEADVYIAYGRDAQAEEILKEALRTQPERNAVRLKLLEIYATRKDARAFEIVASELFSLTKGEGEEWTLASSLGLSIDPDNPLYAGGKLPADVAAKAVAISASTQPLENEPATGLDEATKKIGNDSGNEIAFDFEKPAEPVKQYKNGEDAAGVAGELPGKDAVPTLQDKVPDDIGNEVKLSAEDDDLPVLTTAPSATKDAGPEAEFKAQLATLNFDLEDPARETRADEPAKEKSEGHSTEHAMDFDFNLDDLDIGRPSTTPGVDAKRGNLVMDQTPFASIDTAGIDFGTDRKPAQSITPAMDFDLAGIDLDLSPLENAKPATQSAPAAVPKSAESVQSIANPEMATKLDLAAAYHDIGDKEGARELLDEVMRGGTPSQVVEAQQMLEKFALAG